MTHRNYLKKIQERLITNKRDLLRGISMDFFGPEMVRVYPVGYMCNHSCPSLTLFEYKKIIATLPPGVSTVEIVGGGEPLLYKDIALLTQIIKRKIITVLLLRTVF